jgi:hypothetical protein
MQRLVPVALFLALIAIFQPLASAQGKACVPIACRAEYPITTCDKPRPGAKVLSGRVLGMSRDCSNDIVQMQIEQWEANKVPPVIEVVVGPCGRFMGKVGDPAQVAVMEPAPDIRRYDLACRYF